METPVSARPRPASFPPRRFRLLLLVALLAASCAAPRPRGVYHTVLPGQTAYRIALAYGIDTARLLIPNRIPDPRLLRPGQRLWIPDAGSVLLVPRKEERSPDVPVRLVSYTIHRPLEGETISGFGRRNRGPHHGIDIPANKGTPVRTAASGTVLYAGNGMRGYGNVVVVDHGEGVTTLYGHLNDFRVESGDAVPAGAVIGTVGDTGNAEGSHLHFELRFEDEAVDPEPYFGRTMQDGHGS